MIFLGYNNEQHQNEKLLIDANSATSVSDLRSPLDLKQLEDKSPTVCANQQALQMANTENFPRLSRRSSSGLNSLNDIRNSFK